LNFERRTLNGDAEAIENRRWYQRAWDWIINREPSTTDGMAAGRKRIGDLVAQARAPLRARLALIDALANDEERRAALAELQRDLPTLLEQINDSPAQREATQLMADLFGTELLNNLTEAK
jgi:hypothetical protein